MVLMANMATPLLGCLHHWFPFGGGVKPGCWEAYVAATRVAAPCF
jgi:hypothetical protein